MKEIKRMGAKYDVDTSKWTLPEGQEHFFDDYVKVYLEVPFNDKELVKEMGAKWCKTNKKWFISKKRSEDFLKWITSNQKYYLKIPFEFVEDVKKRGGKFDKSKKCWYLSYLDEDFEDFIVNV
jgi:hypothetical protein